MHLVFSSDISLLTAQKGSACCIFTINTWPMLLSHFKTSAECHLLLLKAKKRVLLKERRASRLKKQTITETRCIFICTSAWLQMVYSVIEKTPFFPSKSQSAQKFQQPVTEISIIFVNICLQFDTVAHLAIFNKYIYTASILYCQSFTASYWSITQHYPQNYTQESFCNHSTEFLFFLFVLISVLNSLGKILTGSNARQSQLMFALGIRLLARVIFSIANP